LFVTDTANVGNLRTDNLLYSNGSPWDLGGNPAGNNTQLQFNDNNEFGASANLTFNNATNLLTVLGNTQFNNANLGNLAIANYVNVTYQINGNIANFSGNLFSLNANLGNIVNANFFIGSGNNLSNIQGANVSGTVENANIANIAYSVDVANVSGIGNIATINLDGNVYNILHGDGSWAPESSNIANANYANFAGQVVDSNQSNITSLGNLTDLTVGNLVSNVVIIDGNINATGNVTASNFIGRFANGNSYVEIYNNYQLMGYDTTTDTIVTMDFLDYSTTDKHKTILTRGNNAARPATNMMAVRWPSTAAINTISFSAVSGSFIVGSTFALYGVSAKCN
jgi:hypothetical protein